MGDYDKAMVFATIMFQPSDQIDVDRLNRGICKGCAQRCMRDDVGDDVLTELFSILRQVPQASIRTPQALLQRIRLSRAQFLW